jgi:putative CocE/NonD family hydrolase
MAGLRTVREIEHTLIPLRDGTRLAARIWLPQDAEQRAVPAILEYLPYRKRDGTIERDALTHPYFAARGYAGVRVDIRGSGESDGLLTDEYSEQELHDALEVIAWLAAQPWCSGAVGMMGISWGGFNALQVAALRPPALKAIVTLCSTDDRYADDVHYMGGAKLNAGFGWAGFFFSDMCRPPDPALVGGRWREMWLARLEGLPLFLERWLRHQHRDAYWKHGSVCEDYSAIQCPVFAVGGWTDGYTNAIPRLLQNLSVPRKGLIGPWAHAYPHFALPGPQIGFLQEALRWWDHWLKEEATGIMDEPMLRAWMCDSVVPAAWHESLPGRWVSEPSWPSPGVRGTSWHLTDHGLSGQGGALAPQRLSSPLTVGRHAGQWCPFGRGSDQADDQGDDDRQSLVFETTPLAETMEILGAPVVEFEVAADKPVAHLIARLCDARPDGTVLRVSFGVLNLAHRDSHESPSALEPGRRYRVRLKLNDCGARFPAGHRIRLALSTSYWPMVWPAPERATVTLFGGSLMLPVRPVRSETVGPFPAPDSAPAEPVTRLGPGVVRYERPGLTVSTEWKHGFSLDENDPSSAAAEMQKCETISREQWRVRIESTMRMTCTRDAFRLTASIRASEGDSEVLRRDWDRSIPRNLL